MTDKTFVLFNVFGTLRLERQRVDVFASAITTDHLTIERSYTDDLSAPVESLPAGSVLVVQFAARLGMEGEKNKIFLQNMSARSSGSGDYSTPPEAHQAIKKVLKMF